MVGFWSNHLHVQRQPRQRLALPQVLRRHHPRPRARHASRTCWSPARCTRRCCSTSTTTPRCGTPPTRTRAASCSSCTPSAGARATPSRWSRTRRSCCPATPSTRGRPGRRRTTPAATPPGPVQVLGFGAANAAADGSALTVDYLRYLAHHPATATRIAHQAVPALRRRPALRRPGRPRWPRPSPTPAPTSRRRCARSSRTPTSWPGGGCWSATRSRTSSRPAGCWGSRCSPRTDDQSLRPRVHLAAADHAALPVAATRRPAARRRRVVLGDPDAQLVPDALGPRGRGGGRPRTSPTASPAPTGCRSASLRLDAVRRPPLARRARHARRRPHAGGGRRRHRVPREHRDQRGPTRWPAGCTCA